LPRLRLQDKRNKRDEGKQGKPATPNHGLSRCSLYLVSAPGDRTSSVVHALEVGTSTLTMVPRPVDEAMEARLYRWQRDRLPATALFSVGHRSTLSSLSPPATIRAVRPRRACFHSGSLRAQQSGFPGRIDKAIIDFPGISHIGERPSRILVGNNESNWCGAVISIRAKRVIRKGYCV
jgi:hypothetical protein